ncbi:uncharacterized protein [Magallana gigas]|uniref:uncharacterized protein n=1 Tax=Magallana gigas TaxID=29159 RepID=UPI00148AAF97|nr:uncharacterized protein LOC117692534 [Crassostrea gigas]
MDNERNGLNMTFRYFPTGVYLLKISFVVLLFLSSSTEKTNFFLVNSCTDIKLKDIPVDVFQSCSETDKTIHCLPDENDNLGLSCFAVTWISEGKCPSYNSYQGNMDEKDCSTDYNRTCPGVLYKSPLSVLYTGCYINELTRPTTTPTAETMNETNQIQLSQSCDKHLELYQYNSSKNTAVTGNTLYEVWFCVCVRVCVYCVMNL